MMLRHASLSDSGTSRGVAEISKRLVRCGTQRNLFGILLILNRIFRILIILFMIELAYQTVFNLILKYQLKSVITIHKIWVKINKRKDLKMFAGVRGCGKR